VISARLSLARIRQFGDREELPPSVLYGCRRQMNFSNDSCRFRLDHHVSVDMNLNASVSPPYLVLFVGPLSFNPLESGSRLDSIPRRIHSPGIQSIIILLSKEHLSRADNIWIFIFARGQTPPRSLRLPFEGFLRRRKSLLPPGESSAEIVPNRSPPYVYSCFFVFFLARMDILLAWGLSVFKSIVPPVEPPHPHTPLPKGALPSRIAPLDTIALR